MFLLASRRLLLVLLVIGPGLPTPSAAQAPGAPIAWDLPATLAALDSLNGIGPLTFGMPLAQVPLVLTETTATRTALVGARAGRVALVVQGMRLYGGFVLVAYRGLVTQLNLGVSAATDAQPLLAVLQARYGPGQHLGYQTFQWVGQVITLRYVPVIGRREQPVCGSLYLLSNALAAQQQAEAAETRPAKAR